MQESIFLADAQKGGERLMKLLHERICDYSVAYPQKAAAEDLSGKYTYAELE